MADPINPLYLKILDSCKAQSPEPLYPKPFAIAENLERQKLDDALDYLRAHGLVRLTDWVQNVGQGYALTDEGEKILANPLLLDRPLPKPKPPELETGAEHSESTWQRGEKIRACLLNPVRPVVTRVLLVANIAVFVAGWFMASRAGVAGPYFTGQSAPALGVVYADLGAFVPGLLDSGEWWRSLSHAFVHRGIIHLLLNMYFLFNLGPLVESLWGSTRFAILYTAAAFASSVGPYLMQESAVGASGALCGLLMSMVVWLMMSRVHLPSEFVARWQSGLITNIFLIVIISFMPGVSWSCHLAGAIGGGLIAIGLHWNRFGMGAMRWLGVIAAALVPVATCVLLFLAPNERRDLFQYKAEYPDIRRAIDLKLIQAVNQVGGRMIHQGSPADEQKHKEFGEKTSEIIKDLREARARFERKTTSVNPDVQASAQEQVANLDLWLSFFETCQGVLAAPETWEKGGYEKLRGYHRRALETQESFVHHDLVNTIIQFGPRKRGS